MQANLGFRKRIFNPRMWAYIIFWSWNAIFAAFTLFGFFPVILPEIIDAVREGWVQPFFLIYGFIIISVPVITIGLGLTIFRRDPIRLLALGYGVEGPLMMVLAIRFFLVGQATWAMGFILSVAALGLLTLLWHLIDFRIRERGGPLAYIHMIGLAFLISMGIYASIWATFYAIPLASLGLDGIGYILGDLPRFFTDIWNVLRDAWRYGGFFELLLVIFGAPLFFFTAALFVILPVAILYLYGRVWWRGMQSIGVSAGVVITLLVIGGNFILFQTTNIQPQARAFASLETPATTIDEMEALLRQEDTLRRGLLNSYLARTRYASSNGEVFHVQEIYRTTYDNFSGEQAAAIQTAYESVAQPLLYQPVEGTTLNYSRRYEWDDQVLNNEPTIAADLYEDFFDISINEGEREAVVDAARTIWDPAQAREAWQAVDDREIYLQQQEIAFQDFGDFAEIEIHEVYLNQTGIRQEVVYYFTMPESAVITGVWLGNGPEKEFEYRVSPRGAAQQIYREEVTIRQIDPALIEQIGVQQYRLRVFPVEPPIERLADGPGINIIEQERPLHMWLRFQVMRDAETGTYPMPYLADQFNIYWDRASERTVNGTSIQTDLWLPESIDAASNGLIRNQSHALTYPDGRTVMATPLDKIDQLPPIPEDLQIAVVLDRSRSMEDRSDAVERALSFIAAADPAADLYLTASEIRAETPTVTGIESFNREEIIYYGKQNGAELLTQFNQLYSGTAYDIIVVLTDESGYDLGGDAQDFALPPAPVWFVHLDGAFPDGYDDHTLEAIQATGGGSAGSIEEAFRRYAIGLGGTHPGVVHADLIDGYLWEVFGSEETVRQPSGLIEHSPSDQFGYLAARRLILAEMTIQKGEIESVDTLDQLHAIAVENSVVTPYSSMIVLVNDRQQQRLDELEGQGDRFEREFEAKGETERPTPPVTGVPEPEEWLLIILSAAALGWYFTQRRQKTRLGRLPM